MTDLRINDIENVEVGDTPAARKLAELARARSKERLGDVLADIGSRIGVGPWTVYHWLRGERSPPRTRLATLLAMTA